MFSRIQPGIRAIAAIHQSQPVQLASGKKLLCGLNANQRWLRIAQIRRYATKR